MVAHSKVKNVAGCIIGLFIEMSHGWAMDMEPYTLELSGQFLERHQSKRLLIKVKPFYGGYGEYCEYGKYETYYEKVLPAPQYEEVLSSTQATDVHLTDGGDAPINRIPKKIVYEFWLPKENDKMDIFLGGSLCRYNESRTKEGCILTIFK